MEMSQKEHIFVYDWREPITVTQFMAPYHDLRRKILCKTEIYKKNI